METTAAHVTMLQRSPTYIISLPGEDPIASWLGRHLSARVAYGITRWKNVLLALCVMEFSNPAIPVACQEEATGLVAAG